MRRNVAKRVFGALVKNDPRRLYHLLDVHRWTVNGDFRALDGLGEHPFELTGEEVDMITLALSVHEESR